MKFAQEHLLNSSMILMRLARSATEDGGILGPGYVYVRNRYQHLLTLVQILSRLSFSIRKELIGAALDYEAEK